MKQIEQTTEMPQRFIAVSVLRAGLHLISNEGDRIVIQRVSSDFARQSGTKIGSLIFDMEDN